MKLLLLLPMAATLLSADFQAAMKEPNLERRSERLLENADAAMDEARRAYDAADNKGFDTALKEVGDSAEASFQALRDTGKSGRKHPKYFKKAELKTRELSKRLDTFEKDVSMDHRPTVLAVKHRVDELNDKLVMEIMTKKK